LIDCAHAAGTQGSYDVIFAYCLNFFHLAEIALSFDFNCGMGFCQSPPKGCGVKKDAKTALFFPMTER
jgi:hypothetical protein